MTSMDRFNMMDCEPSLHCLFKVIYSFPDKQHNGVFELTGCTGELPVDAL